MNSKDNLICFKHCSSASIFCKKVPNNCPVCDSLLDEFLLEPFAIPYPLANAREHPYSVVIRPSKGNFLDDYKVSDDLHIGVTDSNGTVLEYDTCGLIQNDILKWTDCAAIRFIPESWETFWDQILLEICKDTKWNSNNYNGFSLNCFSFVITFLNNLKYSEVQFMNKEDMCEVFILPKLQNILKYALLYRELKDKSFCIQE